MDLHPDGQVQIKDTGRPCAKVLCVRGTSVGGVQIVREVKFVVCGLEQIYSTPWVLVGKVGDPKYKLRHSQLLYNSFGIRNPEEADVACLNQEYYYFNAQIGTDCGQSLSTDLQGVIDPRWQVTRVNYDKPVPATRIEVCIRRFR